MAHSIGTIKQMSGVVMARNAQGEDRILKVGDIINFGETISTVGAGSHVLLSFADGRELDIGGNDGIFLDKSVYAADSFGDEAIVSSKTMSDVVSGKSVQEMQQALLRGEDVTNLEETAAGDTAAGNPSMSTNATARYLVGGHEANVNSDLRDLGTGEGGGLLFTAPTALDVNNPPVAVNDAVGVSLDQETGYIYENHMATINVLPNDFDLDVGDTFALNSFDTTATYMRDGEPVIAGTVSEVDGNLVFDPGVDFDYLAVGETQVVTFTYDIIDDSGAANNVSDRATVSITITGTNDRPIVSDINLNANGEGEGGGIVGYYDMSSGEGVSAQVGSIETAGLTGVKLFTLDTLELNGINTLYVQNPSNSNYGSEYMGQLGAIASAVNSGMTLIIHDRYVTEGSQLLPGGESIVFHRLEGDGANIEIIDDSLETGAGGEIDDTSLDGGSRSNHGYIDLESLPEGAIVLMTDGTPEHVVTFSYQYGAGTVIYSTIPLDYYLNGGGSIADNMAIYAANLLEEAVRQGLLYETHDIDQGIDGDTIDDGVNVLAGTLSATDLDGTDTHIFRLVDMGGEREVALMAEPDYVNIRYIDENNADLDEYSTINISIASNDIDVNALDIQSITLLNNDAGDRHSDFELRGDFSALAVGETVTLKFQYYADDTHGFDGTDGITNENSISEIKTVTMTITGTNDQPVVSDINGNGMNEEFIVGIDTLSQGSSSWGHDTFGQIFIATEETLNKVEFNLLDPSDEGSSTYTVEIRNGADEVIYSVNGNIEDGQSEIISLDNLNLDLNIGEKYLVRIVENSGNINTLYSTGNDTDEIGSMFSDDKVAYLQYDIGIRLTYGSGEYVIYESHDATDSVGEDDTKEDMFTTFAGNLSAVIDDDIHDTHTYRLVEESTSVDNAFITAPITVVVDEAGSYTMSGNFNALGAGEVATVTFQYVADDGHGFDGTDGINESSISAPKTVTLTITGTNDQPVVSDVTTTVKEASLADVGRYEDYQYQGQLNVADDDATDTTHTFSIENGSYHVSITTVDSDGHETTSTLPSWAVSALIWTHQLVINLNAETGEYSVSSILFNSLGSNQSMQVSFDYRADDGRGYVGDAENENSLSEIATATLVVQGTNDQPVAYADSDSQWEQFLVNIPTEDALFTGRLPHAFDEDILDRMQYFGVDANEDGHIDVQTISPMQNTDGITPVVDPSQTVVTIDTNGEYHVSNPTFNALSAGENATVTFSYYVDDSSGAVAGDNPHESTQSALQTVTLTILGTNDKPIVSDVSDAQNEELDGNNTFIGTLSAADDDVNNTHLFELKPHSVISDNPLVTDLSVILSPTGEYIMSGNFNALALGESATISFQYRANDQSGLPSWDESRYSDYETVTLTVTGTNDAPIFRVDGEAYVFNYDENSAAGTIIGTVFATDVDYSNTVSYSIESGNPDGYFAIDSVTGAISLTEAGSHAFTNDFETLSNSHSLIVGASDGIVTTSINVTLNENNVNDAPDAINDNGASSISAQYYGYNQGIDGGNLTNIAQIRAFMADNTPDATFTPTLLDYACGTGDLAVGTHLQTFLGTDAASLSSDPVDATDGIIHMSGYLNMNAGTYNFKVFSDDGYVILVDGQAVALFDNIQSPTTHVHSPFTVTDSGLHYVEIIYWDQAEKYVFKAEISSDHGDNYDVFDMRGGTASLVTPEDTALTLTAATLLANDTDQDGGILSITSVQNAINGTVVLNLNGTVTFTPNSNYNGVATFDYTISDGQGGADTATVTLNVLPINDAPVFEQPYTFDYSENSAIGAILGTVHATDVDSSTLTYSITNGNSHGYFAINSTTGAISLTALGAASLANDFETLANTHNLTVRASDGMASASIAVTLNEQNVAEISATHDHVITNAGSSSFLIPEWALLDNDTLVNDITAVSNPNSLTAVLTPQGVVVTDNSGGDGGSFTYTATDGISNTNTTVSVFRDTSSPLDGTSNDEILIGGAGKDKINGNSGDDILIGGAGNDELNGGFGSDILKGDDGDDIMVYGSLDRLVDGGRDTDTLTFESSGSINFDLIANGTIQNIEVLDLTQANIAITNLNPDDVISMTDSDNILKISGSSNDSVASPASWVQTASQSGVDGGYTRYESLASDGVTKAYVDLRNTIVHTDF